MYSIGEFSKMSGLTVKTLRFYHEQGLLEPSSVDDQTGYRYYAANKLETARIITRLRGLGFPLSEIGEILKHSDETDVLEHLERQQQAVERKLREFGEIKTSLDQIIFDLREAREAMNSTNFHVQEKTLDPILVAAIRMQGKYAECGQGFARIGRRFGRYICGKPLLLHYDQEYKEDDANFEVCMPIRKGSSEEEISVRELKGGKCVSLIHQGPYDELGRSYAKILDYIQEAGYEYEVPTREVYLKGPGMIFQGNPRKYLTEIQFLVKS
jgi:DNA-binding transcriptional MerR regulator/effector-binding domain-containing protein